VPSLLSKAHQTVGSSNDRPSNKRILLTNQTSVAISLVQLAEYAFLTY
jgi:hypothetical protein